MKNISKKQSTWADESKIDWLNTGFMIFFPIVAILSTVLYLKVESFSYSILGVAIFFYLATGLSITAGYHRLFSHRGYEANKFIEFLYLFFGAGCFENSALKWCTDHRVHHRYVDKENDPYNIKRGFWYAHIGWICKTGNPKSFKAYQRDLVSNKLIVWQDKYYLPIAITSGILLPTLIGGLFGSALGGFAIAGLLRIVIVHHFTFFINSLCHVWGKQTYTDTNSAKDNPILAFFTYGEGYHNYHHLFHNDYRNGIRWYDFDPTKWLIKFLSYIGMAKKLKKAPQILILKSKLQMKNKKLELIGKRSEYHQKILIHVKQMRSKIEISYESWLITKERYKKEYQALKKVKTDEGRARLAQIKHELKLAKYEYRMAYYNWKKSVALLLELSALPA